MKTLKYRINVLLAELPHKRYKEACIELKDRLGVSVSMFNLIRTYTTDQRSCMSSDQLLIVADYFNCTVDNLLNKLPVQ